MSVTQYLGTQFKKLGWLLLSALTSQIGHIVVLAFGLGLVCWGGLELSRSSQVAAQNCPACPDPLIQQSSIQLSPAVQLQPQSATLSGTMTIDVAGAVKKPGLYTLSQPARVADAIVKAGGFNEMADTIYIAQKLNLATKLEPDSKLYIPAQGENWQSTAPTHAPTTTTKPSLSTNINTASKTELMELPGIGEVTAEKIITNRPYGSISELTEKEVITETVYSKIATKITIE